MKSNDTISVIEKLVFVYENLNILNNESIREHLDFAIKSIKNMEKEFAEIKQAKSDGRLVESDKIFSVIDTMIIRANELNRISDNDDVSPIEAGRASWERRGILFSLKIITETTGIIQFEDLFECGDETAEAALAEMEEME